jgi:hypothetical protein
MIQRLDQRSIDGRAHHHTRRYRIKHVRHRNGSDRSDGGNRTSTGTGTVRGT